MTLLATGKKIMRKDVLLADLGSLSRRGYPRPLDSRTVASSPPAPHRITSGQTFKVRLAWTKLKSSLWGMGL